MYMCNLYIPGTEGYSEVMNQVTLSVVAEMYPGFQIMGSSGPLLEKFGGPLLRFGGPANL